MIKNLKYTDKISNFQITINNVKNLFMKFG